MMKKISYKVLPLSVTGAVGFPDATAEELRVLLALIESNGQAESIDELVRISKTSRPRCVSALALWEAEEVITPHPCNENSTENESQITAKMTAKTVRDEHLANMLDELARLMDKPALSTEEIKSIVEIYERSGVSCEYIVTLAANIASVGKLGVVRLGRDVDKLVSKNCETLEQLEKYLKHKEEESTAEWELRSIFGIYNRTPTASERKYFKKWTEDYGFGAPIISSAYDITVMHSSKLSYPYMDKILNKWFEAGCKTVAECEEFSRREKAEKASAQKQKRDNEKETSSSVPRHAGFDVNEAFRRALNRSFGDDTEEEG